MLFVIIFAAVILLRLLTYAHRYIRCKRLLRFYLKWCHVDPRKIQMRSAEIYEIFRLGKVWDVPYRLDSLHEKETIDAFRESLSHFRNEINKTIYPNFLLKSLFLAPICLIDLLNSRGISVSGFFKVALFVIYFFFCVTDLFGTVRFLGILREFLSFLFKNLFHDPL